MENKYNCRITMRISWIISALLLLASPSFAMIKKKPPPEPPKSPCYYETRWSGFTVGLNAGALINASNAAVRPSGDFLLPINLADNPQRTDIFAMHGAAFVTGVQVGGNYQMKVVVLGMETDFNYSTLSRTHHLHRTLKAPLDGSFNDRLSQLFNWFGTVRPRVGIAINPVLIYFTGGLAYGHIKSKTHVNFSSTGDQYAGSESKWRLGWTLGTGVEWGFTRHWSMKCEYLFVDLRKVRYSDPNEPPPSFPELAYKSRINTEGHILRIGFNYTL